jgi:hypothetical protein
MHAISMRLISICTKIGVGHTEETAMVELRWVLNFYMHLAEHSGRQHRRTNYRKIEGWPNRPTTSDIGAAWRCKRNLAVFIYRQPTGLQGIPNWRGKEKT